MTDIEFDALADVVVDKAMAAADPGIHNRKEVREEIQRAVEALIDGAREYYRDLYRRRPMAEQ